MELRPLLRRTGAELGLAATVAVGSRTTRLRTLLTTLGVALGVVVLLIAASVPRAYATREQRVAATTSVFASTSQGRLNLLVESTVYHGVTITENDLQVTPGTGAVPLPPGLTQIPRPGEVVVSPVVARLLRAPGGSELRRRLRARVVGTLGPAALAEPDSAVLYRGSSEAVAAGEGVVQRFGGGPGTVIDLPIITVLVIVIVVALLLPVAVFVATAARFGAEERDGRLAAMRLLGADRAMTVRIAAAESLLGALAGLVLGAAVFTAVAGMLARAGVGGVSVFASDLRPAPGFAVLVGVSVPLCAVLATLVSVRRVAIEPLGVSTRRTTRSRRVAWRLVVPAVGFALLAPLVGSVDSINSTLGQVDATVGVMLVLVGVTALLPWAVETVVRRAPDGPLPWLLAIRRLRLEEGTTGRVIGAIGLAVAGAVALSVVFGAAEAHVRKETQPQGPTRLTVNLQAPTRAAAQRDLADLRHAPGVGSSSETQVSRAGRLFDVSVTVTLRRSDPDGGPVRDVAAALDPVAGVVAQTGGDDAEQRLLGDLRRVLVGGALVVLTMIGASLLVVAGEGMRERRPALAVLAAVGTRRSTAAWSVLVQAAVPVLVGLMLAVVLGTALGAMLTAVVGVHLEYDWRGIALMLAAGAAVIAAVTGLTLPALARAMTPEALRVE